MINNIVEYKNIDYYFLKKGYKYYRRNNFVEETNYIKAAEYFKKAADLENAEAQYMYYKMCLEEKTLSIDEGRSYLLKSAKNNYSSAQIELGIRYFNNEYIARNYERAVELFNKAKENGNSAAYNCLAHAYMYGKGVINKDYKKAYEYFFKAHELGECTGTYFVGDCYYNGIGVEKDRFEALNYYALSYKKGYRSDYTNFISCLKEITVPIKKCRDEGKVFTEEAFYNLGKINGIIDIIEMFLENEDVTL